MGDDFVILIGGDAHSVGEEKYAQQILKIVHTSGGFARYVGMLPAEAIGNFYTLLDVLVVPSINSTEAFGMVQVEAMRFGVPVVATDLPGVRVCVRKTGMGEIVPIRDKKAIAEAITEIVLNPEVYRKEKRVIDSEFSNQKILAVFESIFVSEKSSLSDDRRQ